MQAFQIIEPQKPAELREVPVPEPGPGQVLVKVGGRAPATPTCISWRRPRTGSRVGSPSRSATRTRGGSRSWGRARPGSRPETR